jgi:putative spermidine/putrescine transport system permease protein
VRLNRRTLLAVLAIPALVEILYLILPVLVTFRMSLFGFGRLSGIHYTPSLGNYKVILDDPFYVTAWLTTLRLSTESAALTVLASALVAWMLWAVGGRYRSYLTVVILTPLLVSGIVRAYGWIAMIGPGSPLDALSMDLHLGPAKLLYHEPAVVIGFVHIFLPFGVLMFLTRLDSIPPSVIRAAHNLGANSLQVALRVLLPLVYPVGVSAFLLVFALAMASYAVPAILGGGRVLTVATVIFDEQNGTLDWPRAAALGISLTLVTIVIMVAYQVIASRLGNRQVVVEV